jgi:hypothetical protein
VTRAVRRGPDVGGLQHIRLRSGVTYLQLTMLY